MLLHFALVLHFGAILITFCVNITFCGVTYTDKKRKQQLNSHERLRIVVVSGLSSIHDVKSEFPLSIYNHFRYSTADRMNPTARYIFVYIPSSFNKIFLLKIAYHSAIITNGSFYYCKLNR